jgi:hypothetical protein
METWRRWCQFDDDSAFRVRVVGISGMAEENLPGPGLAISDKGGYAGFSARLRQFL